MMYISKLMIKQNNLNFIKTGIKNKKYLFEEIKNTKNLLDDINGYPLDFEQRKAVICDEFNTLVIAGAGSGKTLTIVGKVRYLIEVKEVKQDEILCISFTNDSVRSLKNALTKKYNYNVDVYTFHKLCLDIIRDNIDNITICEEDLLEYIIDEFFLTNVDSKLLKTNTYEVLKRLIFTFISLFKSSNYDIIKFDIILKKIKNDREKILLKIIKYIYITYQEELKSTNKIDFNDMINMATNIIKNNCNIKKYKYLIIDEYQDTSITKYNLIREIQKRFNTKLFAVGDDFQSIYRFTGCNLDIFVNFNKYYEYSKILKINNTYRNSKELISCAGDFVMRNNSQIKKKLKSSKSLNKPIVLVYTTDISNTFEKLIDMIDSRILVLGRNNFDINKILSTKIKLNGDMIIYKNKYIRYLTVHKSKGLEEENVILINNENSILGFPSKMKSNNLLKYVLDEKDMYPYEEERRLFYVALTRTKNHVYLLVNKNNSSIFIKEILKYNKNNIKIINL